jgi:DNA-binding NtrC family response regulator
MTLLKRELDTLITQMHSAGIAYNEAVRQFKKRYILEVLAHHRGNQCKAAEELGMHRNTLSRTLAELDMNTAQIRQGVRRPPASDRIGDRAPERARIHNIANAG